MSIKAKIQCVSKIEKIIKEIGVKLDMDPTKLGNKVSAAKSNGGKLYGKPEALLNLLANLVLFPAVDESEWSLVQDRREKMAKVKWKQFKWSDELETVCEYVRESKGRLTFLDSSTAEIVEAIEPDIDSYNEAVEYLGKLLGLDSKCFDRKLTAERFAELESKASAKAAQQQQELLEALQDV